MSYLPTNMEGKVAIITASSTGIGKAIAIRLAQQGVKVIISSRNQEHINEAVKEIKNMGGEAHGIICHVGKKEDRDRLVNQTLQTYGRIDYVIPNAAVSLLMENTLDATESQIQKMFEINYLSTFSLIKATLPHVKKHKGSYVIVSTHGAYEIVKQAGHYTNTKLMLNALTKQLAVILMNDEIRVNCVCPGLIKTAFSKYIWNDEKIREREEKMMGIKRFGEPEQIANAVKFLLSDDASYVNGQCMLVTGRPSSRL